MATTEVQKVPGNFNLPADWPKLEIPDTRSNLLGDWIADSLDLGPMPGNWTNSISNAAGSFTPNKGDGNFFKDPLVGLDAESGKKFVTFDRSRLRLSGLSILVDDDITIITTVRPSQPTASGSSTSNTERIVSGANNGFRAISRGFDSTNGTNQFRLGVTNRTTIIPTQLSGGTKYVVVGRFSSTSLNGKSNIDSAYTYDTNSRQIQTQTYFNLGGNDTSNTGTTFRGDIFRVQIWTRILSDTDVEAVFRENKKLFKIS